MNETFYHSLELYIMWLAVHIIYWISTLHIIVSLAQ